jgi:3-oxoacyl-(acyl-carrier-protein) synthase
MSRVFITKASSVSPLGLSPDETLLSLTSGKNCLGPIPEKILPAGFPVNFIGLLPGQKLTEYSDNDSQFNSNKDLWLNNLFSDLDLEKLQVDRIIFSHNYAPNSYELLRKKSNHFYNEPLRVVCENDFIRSLSKRFPSIINIPKTTVHNTCASALTAIALAKKYINAGLSHSCLVIVFEVTNHSRHTYISLNALGALNSKATDVNSASLPFSDDRAGFVKADALGFAVVQSEKIVRENKFEPLCILRGAAVTSDCHSLTDGVEDGSMVEKTIQQVLSEVKITPSDIDYVSAHGSGTYLNDKIELTGLNRVFKGRSKEVLLSSNKSQFGHALCATGIVEVDALIKMFRHRFVSGNINYNSKLDTGTIHIPKHPILNHSTKIILKNSFGFGGYNASAIFENVL